MERQRTIAASPVRSAAEAWEVVTSLIGRTLERSPNVPTGSVTGELAALNGLGPALIAGGHLESAGLVLRDVDLHLTIRILTADAALAVSENLNPVPGGGTATSEWKLHLPLPPPLAASVARAAKRSSHLSVEPPPTAERQKRRASSALDLDALRRTTSSW